MKGSCVVRTCLNIHFNKEKYNEAEEWEEGEEGEEGEASSQSPYLLAVLILRVDPLQVANKQVPLWMFVSKVRKCNTQLDLFLELEFGSWRQWGRRWALTDNGDADEPLLTMRTHMSPYWQWGRRSALTYELIVVGELYHVRFQSVLALLCHETVRARQSFDTHNLTERNSLEWKSCSYNVKKCSYELLK